MPLIPRRRPLVLLALLALPLAAAPARAQGCQTISGVAYGSYVDRSGQVQALLLDLMTPGGTTPAPLVLWLHGGGWARGSRLPIPSYVTALCARGYAVASADYRLTGTAIFPAQIQDVKGAVRFLRANAAAYGLDPGRIAVWGESAGGHLAALLGTSGGAGVETLGNASADLEGATGGNPGISSRVQAVVDWYGPTDFVQMHFYPTTANHDAATSDESVFVGGPIQTRPEVDALADPITYASPDDPPFLVMHGTADQLIPFNQSERLRDALLAQGVRVTFSPVENAGHGNSPWTSSSSIWQVVYGFLDHNLRDAPAAAAVAGDDAAPASALVADEDASAAGLPLVTVAAADPTADPGRFTIARAGSTAADLTVAYTLSGTLSGSDDAALPGSVTIPAGAAAATVDVLPPADGRLRPAVFAALALAPGSGYAVGSPAAAGVDFSADPLTGPVVSVAATDPTAAEPADPGAFQLTRTGSTTSPLTVRIALGGTATNGVDYAAIPDTITFDAGVSRVAVAVRPIDDYATEPTETVTLSVQPDPAYLVGPYLGSVVTIADDDVPGLPTLASLAVASASVVGGQGTTGTVTLSAPAPAGGSAVSLASGDTAAATVPATVAVPAGASSATFAIATKPVAAAATVQLSASYRGIARAASLAVQPPALSSVSLSPTSVAGGCKVPVAKVILTGKAPAGGLVVSLASANPAAAVPASVTVPAGASSAGFALSIVAVASTQTGAVSASYRGVTKSAGLTVRPIGLLSLALSPNPVAGGASSSGTATLECAAGSGGGGDVQVALSTSRASVARPAAASLVVPVGSSAASFTVTTSPVAAASSAVIRATANGTAKSATLAVDP
jgi:acetyl esterase/lipase